MKTASVLEIKKELNLLSQKDLISVLLRLSKFKKENKELLTYLLYDAEDEESYVQDVKYWIDDQFDEVNRKSYYIIKKNVRKILSNTKKYIRYSQNKETEVELLIYYCRKLYVFSNTVYHRIALFNIIEKQVEIIKRKINKLDEDLQYDYQKELENIM